MTPRVWPGESLRWYLLHARHPLKNYLVGHYWRWFERPRFWIRYDGRSAISVSLGDYLQRQIFFDGYYERPLIDWLKKNLHPADVLWDIGANIGAVTLVAARHCSRVVAFEPDSRALDLLSRHVGANGITNVTIVPRALADATGTAVLHAGPMNNLGMSTLAPNAPNRDPNAATAIIPTLRADDFVRDHPHLRPTILKLDVEGAEDLVLNGAAELLLSETLRAVVFEDRVAQGRPASRGIIECLAPSFEIDELGASAPGVGDGLSNFLATRRPASLPHAS
jgi:FkbM family methyltransferase